MKVEVLTDTLWHLGRRPAVGEIIDMSEPSALAGEEAGLVVRILAEADDPATPEDTPAPAKKGK